MNYILGSIEYFALLIVLLAGGYLAGLRSGERTKPRRVWLRGDWLRFKFGLYWRKRKLS